MAPLPFVIRDASEKFAGGAGREREGGGGRACTQWKRGLFSEKIRRQLVSTHGAIKIIMRPSSSSFNAFPDNGDNGCAAAVAPMVVAKVKALQSSSSSEAFLKELRARRKNREAAAAAEEAVAIAAVSGSINLEQTKIESDCV